MKQGKLITTANVVKADRAIEYLQRRPKLELVGLGLVYGKPGLGRAPGQAELPSARDTSIYGWNQPLLPRTLHKGCSTH
jgi:hypothetical protein